MTRVMRRAPKRGRFEDDVYGYVERNVRTGEVRIQWFFWTRVWDKEADEWGGWGWFKYHSRFFATHVAGGDGGPGLYPEHLFKNARRAMRHYHRVMRYADEVAFYRAARELAEVEDWRVARV